MNGDSNQAVAKRVLVVDDDPVFRGLFSELLREGGYAVDTAQNGAHALEKVRVRRPDAIVLDLAMPLMNGVEFMAACIAGGLCVDVPIVVMSAAPDLIAATRALVKSGVRAVLSKSFDVAALVAVVEQYA